MTIQCWDTDTLVIRTPVTFDQNAPFTSLTGGTAEAIARRANGSTSNISGTAVIQASGAEIISTWPANTFSAGSYIVQIRATVSGITETLAEDKLIVKDGL